MKVIIRNVMLAAVIIMASCGKDNVDTENEEIVQQEIKEKTPLEVNKVTENLVINGGVKKDGTPPTPTGDLSFDIDGSSSMAFLDEGFSVKLNAENITGAYVLIKSADGTPADNYYDIDLSANNTSSGKIFERKHKENVLSAKQKEETTTLDVDFSTGIEPGTFCYEICVYDANGNISNPQELCVTVEGWGGNNEIVASWNLVKQVEKYNGETTVIPVGESDCGEDSTFTCNSGATFTASYGCYTINEFLLTFNADGTYTYTSEEDDSYIDYDASTAACEAIYKTGESTYTSKGNWAYNADEKHLVILEYQYTDTSGDETETETFTAGNADVLFDGEIEINGNSLLIKIDEGDSTSEIYLDK